MVKAVPGILARIVEQKIAARRVLTAELEAAAESSIKARRDFKRALVRPTPAIIAEMKKASPSKGVFVANFDPAAIARTYESGGAAALSVLTDEPNFQGHLDHVLQASPAGLPILRKDFTISEFDVIESAAAHADAILLIAAILDVQQLRDYRELAGKYRMDALVEVHDADELAAAIDSGAAIIGVNNRNLNTFEVDLDTSLRLAGKIPATVIRVAESGIHSAADVRRLRTAGYHAFLIGEHLMTSRDPAAAIQALLL